VGAKALLMAPIRALWWTIGVMTMLAFALVVALALGLGRIIAQSVSHAARAALASGEGVRHRVLTSATAFCSARAGPPRRKRVQREPRG